MYSLANAIINQDKQQIFRFLQHGEDVNGLDEYGFRPLIETAIVDNVELASDLLRAGADPNLQDVLGGTALHWAVENNNLPLCKLLVAHQANLNQYNFAGQPPLVMALLRNQKPLSKWLIKKGADRTFAQDFINIKLLGHLFELIGVVNLITPDNQFVEVDFEGFFLEITLGVIADLVYQFQHHFAARSLRRYSGLMRFIAEILERAATLDKYTQYRVDVAQFEKIIDPLIRQDPLVIPVAYEGHAITFIRYSDIWVKCDRREDSRLYDNIMFYRMKNPSVLTTAFIKDLIYTPHPSEYINKTLDHILQLDPITELKVEAQISGNCSWANVEATIPAIFFLVLYQLDKSGQSIEQYKKAALDFFHRFLEWSKDRALNFCIKRYNESDSIRKASIAEILAAILFQQHKHEVIDQKRVNLILEVLLPSSYTYILDNYLRVYYYERPTPEGKRFADLLKQHGYLASRSPR